MAPELATGRLHEVAEEVWNDQEANLRTLPMFQQADSLTAEGRHCILQDDWHGKSIVMALLKVKTNYWERLPWIFW